MRYQVLACDYDGTIAHHGKVFPTTVQALERLVASGRKLILVTGRELDELLGIFPEIYMFVRVVAENGALLYNPETKSRRQLSEAPPVPLIQALERKKIPLSVGKSILATWRPHEVEMLEAIQEQGVEWHVIFNKDAVMALPSGVNKATGLKAALKELHLTAHEVVGVGDAENDHAFLTMCECGVALANAVPQLKERTDWTAHGDHGIGVIELIEEMINDDLAARDKNLKRHHVLIGIEPNGTEVWLSPYNGAFLVAGPSEQTNASSAGILIQQLSQKGYQYCVIDTKGQFSTLPNAVQFGNAQQTPVLQEVIDLLTRSKENAVVHLLDSQTRQTSLSELLQQLGKLRKDLGHPHWIVINDVNDVLPVVNEPQFAILRDRTILGTTKPEAIAKSVMESLKLVFSNGPEPSAVVENLCESLAIVEPNINLDRKNPENVLVWAPGEASCRWAKLGVANPGQ